MTALFQLRVSVVKAQVLSLAFIFVSKGSSTGSSRSKVLLLAIAKKCQRCDWLNE